MYQFYLFEEIAIFSDGSHFSDGGWCSLILFLKADHLRMNPTQSGLNWLKKLKIFDFQIIFLGQNQFYLHKKIFFSKPVFKFQIQIVLEELFLT